MRYLLRLALALTVATMALIGPFAHAQGTGQVTNFTYRDGDGAGRLTVTDLGADGTTGFRVIRVSLLQNGVRYDGSGISQVLEQQSSFVKTLVSFTLLSPGGRSYVFQGTTISGITLSGQGTWHRVGTPGNRFPWNVLVGG